MSVRGLKPEAEEGMVGPGDVLAGKYRIEKVLGVGGMGVVVSAVHLKLDERVAIKFLLPGALDNPDAVARFEREARAAVKIRSEHVARVIDVGTLESGAPFIVMEHLQGDDLAQVVKKQGPLGVDEALTYMLQVCEVLAEAHALGIVHRDLKPGNLFLIRRADGAPCIKVLDFGISKLMPGGATSEPQASLTATDTVLGSPIYMSPEQMTAPKSVDARADVWSFAATLFMLLTGKPPFDGDTIPQVCGLILLSQATPLLDLRPDAPPGLGAVISRCLQRDVTVRYPNIAELAIALCEFAPPEARASAERAARVLASGGVAVDVSALPGGLTTSGSYPRVSAPGSITGSGQLRGAAPGSVTGGLLVAGAITGGGRPSVPGGSVTGDPLRPSLPAGSVTDGLHPRTLDTWVNTGVGPGAPGRSRSVLVAGIVVGVLGVGVAIGALTSRGDAPAPAAPSGGPASAEAPASAAPPAASSVAVVPAPPTASASAAPADSAPSDARPGKPRATRPPPPPPVTPAATPRKKGTGDLFDER